jgi:hypothetical protein
LFKDNKFVSRTFILVWVNQRENANQVLAGRGQTISSALHLAWEHRSIFFFLPMLAFFLVLDWMVWKVNCSLQALNVSH